MQEREAFISSPWAGGCQQLQGDRELTGCCDQPRACRGSLCARQTWRQVLTEAPEEEQVCVFQPRRKGLGEGQMQQASGPVKERLCGGLWVRVLRHPFQEFQDRKSVV